MKRNLKKENYGLTKRYLLWCYKTTKEKLDWIDRKFTQAVVDHHILKQLRAVSKKDSGYLKRVKEFKTYITKKEKRGMSEKFLNFQKKSLKPEYIYLSTRLAAIEKSIIDFLGKRELKDIQTIYEQEMTRRILESRDHT